MRLLLSYGGLLAGLLAAPAAPRAQLREADTLRWHASVSANGTLSTGNVRRFVSLFGGELLHMPGRWGFKSANSYQYGTFAGLVSEDDLASRNFAYWQPSRSVYPFLMAWLERSQRQQVDLRWQVGGGATWRLAAGADHNLRLSAGACYEQASFRRSDFTAPEYAGRPTWHTWRATARLAGSHRLTNQGLRLAHECWVQPSLRDGINYRIYASGSLSLPLAARLRLTASVVHTYDSIHLDRIRPDDTLVLLGLRWETTLLPSAQP